MVKNPTPHKRRRRDPRRSRDRIARAAIELFTTHGYHGTTTPMIAERSGMAEGSMYRHFETKQHLLNYLYQASVGALLKYTGSQPSAPCAAQLRHLAEAWCDLAARDPALVRLAFFTRLGNLLDTRSKEARRQVQAAVAEIIVAGKSAGAVRPGAGEVLAEVWFSLVLVALQRISQTKWTPRNAGVLLVLDAAWDAIRGDRTGAAPRSGAFDPPRAPGPLLSQ